MPEIMTGPLCGGRALAAMLGYFSPSPWEGRGEGLGLQEPHRAEGSAPTNGSSRQGRRFHKRADQSPTDSQASVTDHPARLDGDAPVASGSQLLVMGDQDQGGAQLLIERHHQRHDGLAGRKVQAPGGLVGQ